MAKTKKKVINVDKIEEGIKEKVAGEITSFKRKLKDLPFELTKKQKDLLKVIEDNNIIFIQGPAGTSKTWTSCYYSISAYSERKFEKIICTKPIQEAGEKLGMLPGSVDDKISPHYESFKQNYIELLGKETVGKLLEKDIIDFKPVSFMRGINCHNTLMFCDEAQNFDIGSLILFITRMGRDSKIIISGDISQSDIDDKYSIATTWLADLLKDVPGVAIFKFDNSDNLRNPFLIEITKKYDDAKASGNLPKKKFN